MFTMLVRSRSSVNSSQVCELTSGWNPHPSPPCLLAQALNPYLTLVRSLALCRGFPSKLLLMPPVHSEHPCSRPPPHLLVRTPWRTILVFTKPRSVRLLGALCFGLPSWLLRASPRNQVSVPGSHPGVPRSPRSWHAHDQPCLH